jgi:hypothetical protein
MIEELSKRANDSDLIALLATTRDAQVYNVALARELRDVVEALRHELERRQSSVLGQSSEIRVGPTKAKIAEPTLRRTQIAGLFLTNQ